MPWVSTCSECRSSSSSSSGSSGSCDPEGRTSAMKELRGRRTTGWSGSTLLARLRASGRDAWRRAPWVVCLVAGLPLVGAATAVAVMAIWASAAAARLDLDAVQDTPLVFAGGRRLQPGVAVRQVGESLERLRYEEVSGAPRRPGEFHRSATRLEIFLRARDDVSRPATRVRLDLQGSRIVGAASVTGDLDDRLPFELEPELLTGVGESGLERRRPLAMLEMSRFIPAAVLAAEDHRFYDHRGLDLLAVGRALAVNTSRGEITQGASTLTQQLVKNIALGPERTFSRKIREAVLALAVERRYSKAKILETYLNTVYFGQHRRMAIHGVGAAAQSYWGKDARNLSLAESALLAGMIRAPNRYSPVEHPERAQQRRDIVLHRMRELGVIDEGALNAALSERTQVRGRAGAQPGVPSQAPYFLDYVRAATGVAPGQGEPPYLHDPGSRASAGGGGGPGPRPRPPRKRAPTTPPRSAGGPAPGGPGGARPGHGRDPSPGGRPRLRAVPVQPRDSRAAAARLRLQALRLPGRPAPRTIGRAARGDPGVSRGRPSHFPGDSPGGVGASQLRGPVRRRDHGPPRARAILQRRRCAARPDGRPRRRRPDGARRRVHEPDGPRARAGAWQLRGHPARARRGVCDGGQRRYPRPPAWVPEDHGTRRREPVQRRARVSPRTRRTS